MVLILSQREKMMEETLFFLKDKTELAFVTLEWVKGRQHQAVPFFFFPKLLTPLQKQVLCSPHFKRTAAGPLGSPWKTGGD